MQLNVRRKVQERGFTLIEVLIALMIVGMALPALLLRVQSVSDNTAYMEEKTFAYWIAQNKLQELQLRRQVEKIATKTKQNDDIEYGGRTWYWQVDVKSTPNKHINELHVKVGTQPDQWLATITGFMYEPKK